MHRFIPLLALFSLLLAACGDDVDTVADEGSGDSGGSRPSVAGDWILHGLTVDGAPIAIPDGDIEMTIEAGEIRGNLGCNSFFGEIDAVDDGTLTVGGLGQTEMACEEQSRMAFESMYGQALGAATAWAVDSNGLTLSGATVEIVYSQAPPPVHQPLEGTVWNFDSIYDGQAASNRSDMAGVTLVIQDGEVVFRATPACVEPLSFGANYQGDREGPFSTTADEAGNDLDCGDADEIITLAYRNLQVSTGFMIDENRLTFIGEAGETVGFSATPAE
jgi:heat shock protein HslJ